VSNVVHSVEPLNLIVGRLYRLKGNKLVGGVVKLSGILERDLVPEKEIAFSKEDDVVWVAVKYLVVDNPEDEERVGARFVYIPRRVFARNLIAFN